MANRSFRRNPQTMDTAATLVRCSIVIGAAGAVTAAGTGGPEVLSVVHTGAGIYTITFSDKFPAAPLNVLHGVQQATPTGVNVTIASSTGNTIVLNTALTTLPGTLADPASGTTIFVLAYYNNTSNPF